MLLHAEFASPELLTRLRIEAEAVARLQHPHIVQIYEVSEQGGKPYLALEFVDGGSLAHKLGGATLSGRQAAELLEPLALAMNDVHKKGIVLRDLKPANVVLPAVGQAKLTDFGLALPAAVGSVQTF